MGAIVLNPDDEVQARLHLVFGKFRELQSARAVMRYRRAHHLPLPVRPLLGPAPHALVWCEADAARVRAILQNPAYAGAYVYGRRRTERSPMTMPCSLSSSCRITHRQPSWGTISPIAHGGLFPAK